MSQPIALLVVHGIGSQKPGESLGSCVRELHQAYPQATLTDRDGDPMTAGELVKRGLPEAVLRLGSWKVHLYEVYWADRLAGEPAAGSFHKFLFEETTWFPWLNWKAGLLPADDYSRVAVWARTVQLWLGQLGVSILLELAELLPKGTRQTVLDQIVADVWNYTHSLRGVLPSGSPLTGAGAAIVDRVAEVALRARNDGCGEVQILAHSLGTVVAYNALTRHQTPGPEHDVPPITRLYTIGSPLEKFLFIWTRLVSSSLAGPELQRNGMTIARGQDLQWLNFYSPLDLVSGRLKRFRQWGALQNIRLWGLGGLVKAHTSYYPHPVVIAHLAKGLGAPSTPMPPSLLRRLRPALGGMVESVSAPLILTLLLFLGALLFIVFGALFGALSGVVLYGTFGWWTAPLLAKVGITLTFGGFVRGLAWTYAVMFLPGVMLFMIKDGYVRAHQLHQAHWR